MTKYQNWYNLYKFEKQNEIPIKDAGIVQGDRSALEAMQIAIFLTRKNPEGATALFALASDPPQTGK